MIKARASGSKVYLYFMKKGRQVRHRIPRNSCFFLSSCFNPRQIYFLLKYFNLIYCVLSLKGVEIVQMIVKMANSVDTDQTAPREQSDLSLYCLQLNFHHLVYTSTFRPWKKIPSYLP